MHDGQVIGTWAWEKSKAAVTYAIAHGYGSLGLREQAMRQASTLSEPLRLRWV
jgi:hypothetical protein